MSFITEGDGYVLVLGQENELKLEIKVGNEGESAYEAQLFVVHHQSLNYIGANTTVVCIISLFVKFKHHRFF